MIHVNFVCLGNICRSPMAEAVFQRMVDEAGLGEQIAVDSAGTGSWHVGEMAHRGTRRVLDQHGIEYTGRARQVTREDMQPEHYVVAMDESNVDELRRRFGDHPRLYRLVEDGCRGLLKTIREEHGI